MTKISLDIFFRMGHTPCGFMGFTVTLENEASIHRFLDLLKGHLRGKDFISTLPLTAAELTQLQQSLKGETP